MSNQEGRSAGQVPPLVALRVTLAVVIFSMVLAYAVGVATGGVPPDRRMDAATLAVIALAGVGILVLVKPGAFDRLRVFEAGGIKVEMLERIRERQAAQESELEDMALVLPLLLPKAERTHLLNWLRLSRCAAVPPPRCAGRA